MEFMILVTLQCWASTYIIKGPLGVPPYENDNQLLMWDRLDVGIISSLPSSLTIPYLSLPTCIPPLWRYFHWSVSGIVDGSRPNPLPSLSPVWSGMDPFISNIGTGERFRLLNFFGVFPGVVAWVLAKRRGNSPADSINWHTRKSTYWRLGDKK